MPIGDFSTPAYVNRLHVVYIAWAGHEVLYVGCTSDLNARMRAHVRSGAEWPELVEHLDYFEFPDKPSALEAERTAIRELQPTYNVKGKVAPLGPYQPARRRFTPPLISLKTVRRSVGAKRKHVALHLGVTDKQLRRIESGRIDMPEGFVEAYVEVLRRYSIATRSAA